jgi:hypothetical protein
MRLSERAGKATEGQQRDTVTIEKGRATSGPSPRPLAEKVPGLLTWLALALGVVGVLRFPRLAVTIALGFSAYILLRLVGMVVLNLVGGARCRAWKQVDWANVPLNAQPEGALRPEDVHHVVLVPNYNEPLEVLSRTLSRLAEQHDARHRLTVVLAMEESDHSAPEKARALKAKFAGQFARLLVTFHPAGLPGEVAGKGSNQAWAARVAKAELVDRAGIPLAHLTLTSCDADSLLHPNYFACLSRLFAADPDRYRRFWQAPIYFHNNVWQIPAPVRLLASFSSATQLARLVSPLAQPLPLSTYSLSFKLADEVGYWDPAVVSEDWHMYLRCFFATQGKVSLAPIFLPAQADAVGGQTTWQALQNRYRQAIRHAWGAEDVGYILQQWHRFPDIPFHKKLMRLTQVLHDHVMLGVSWFVTTLGLQLPLLLHAAPLALPALLGAHLPPALRASVELNLPLEVQLPIVLRAVPVAGAWAHQMSEAARLFYAAGAMGTGAVWAIDSARYPRRSFLWKPLNVVVTIITWALLPVITLLLCALPALYAQTLLLLGRQLGYRPTPKLAPIPESAQH